MSKYKVVKSYDFKKIYILFEEHFFKETFYLKRFFLDIDMYAISVKTYAINIFTEKNKFLFYFSGIYFLSVC